jgi:hypothetical protein
MPSAIIKVNGVAGSNDDLPINALVSLDNQSSGGEIAYQWTILDQPPGPADALSNPFIQNPTFTPKKEGTYLLQLIVNGGPGQLVDTAIVGVRQVKTRERVPAAQETAEDGPRGWAGAAGSMLQRVDAMAADPGVFVGVAGAAGLLPGDVLKVVGTTTIKSGLPGQEVVPTFNKALATLHANVESLLCILESGVDGSLTPAAGALIRVRPFGLFKGATGVPSAIGDPVFVSDAGAVALTPGTNVRRIGAVASFAAGLYDIWTDGSFQDPFLVQDDQPCVNDSSNSAVFVDAVGYPTYTVTVPAARTYLLDVDLSCFVGVAIDDVFFRVLVDGSPIAGQPTHASRAEISAINDRERLSWRIVTPLTAGSHTLKLQWHTNGVGTANVLTGFDFRLFTLQG